MLVSFAVVTWPQFIVLVIGLLLSELLQIREGNRVALVGIGADAVKHMVKAYIAARKYVADDGLDLNSTFVTSRYCCCLLVWLRMFVCCCYLRPGSWLRVRIPEA